MSSEARAFHPVFIEAENRMHRLRTDEALDAGQRLDLVEEAVEFYEKAIEMGAAPNAEAACRVSACEALLIASAGLENFSVPDTPDHAARRETKLQCAVGKVESDGLESVPPLAHAIEHLERALDCNRRCEDPPRTWNGHEHVLGIADAVWCAQAVHIAKSRGAAAGLDYARGHEERVEHLDLDRWPNLFLCIGLLLLEVGDATGARSYLGRSKKSAEAFRETEAKFAADHIERVNECLAELERGHKPAPPSAQQRVRGTLVAMGFSAGWGGVAGVLLGIVTGSIHELGQAAGLLLGGAVFGGLLFVPFHVPPFYKVFRWMGKHKDRASWLGCLVLPLVLFYYVFSWPGVKIAQATGRVQLLDE